MPKARTLSLSDHHVASVAPAEGLLYNPAWRMLEDGDLDALAERVAALVEPVAVDLAGPAGDEVQ